MTTDPANPYVGRYPELRERRIVWTEIVRAVKADVGPVRTLLELGAGYADFVNLYPAEKKIAFDLNPDMRQFANSDVDFRVEDALELPGIDDESVDLIFASNFLEHLHEREEVPKMLASIHRVLNPGGRLMLLQPNYRLCADHYWDDDTHQTVFSDWNMAGFLMPAGFEIVKLVPDFLPFSMKSRLPKWGILVRLYLNSPMRPMGAQMYVLAEKR